MWLDQWNKERTVYKEKQASFPSIKFNCKHFRHNESLLTVGHLIVILWSLWPLVGASFVSSMSCGKKTVSLIVDIVGTLCKLLMKLEKGKKKAKNF